MKRTVKLSCAFVLLCACLMTSCIVIESYGYHSDYKKLSDWQKNRVIRATKPIDSLRYDYNVYIVSIEQVKEYLAAHDSSYVSYWSSTCSGSDCVTPQMMVNEARSLNLTPCILLISYLWERMPSRESLTTPILFIDTEPYGTDVVWKYIQRETTDLTGLEWNKENKPFLSKTRYFVFHGDSLARAVHFVR